MRLLDSPVDLPSIPVFEEKVEGTVELWKQACDSIFGLSPINREDTEKAHKIDSWFVDPISIFGSTYQAMVTRHSNWHVEEAGLQLHVHRYTKGRASVDFAGVPIESETGQITMLDFSRTFSAVHTLSDCQSFFVPHSAIGYVPSDEPFAQVYSPHTVMGHLMGQEMDNLFDLLTHGANAISPRDLQRFLGCVEVAMSPKNASQSAHAYARASLKRSIQIFIEERLAEPDLSVTTVLQRFGVSRASLYRMFEAEDGVRNYINRRRLYRAVTHLADNPRRRGQITQVAEQWAFSSDANFNRMVRREFGVAPGSLFQAPINDPLAADPVSIVHSLMVRAAKRELEPTQSEEIFGLNGADERTRTSTPCDTRT